MPILAWTGLRIGEALALKASDFSDDCRTVTVSRSVWRGQEQLPKTVNAVRVVDIPEALAASLQRVVAGKSNYIFHTRSGRSIAQRNVGALFRFREKGRGSRFQTLPNCGIA